MRLVLDDAACVRVDLRATGLLGGLGHDPTLTARAGRLEVEFTEGADVPVHGRFAVEAIEVPGDIPAADRRKMRENMLSRDVLDAERFPAVEFRGRYAGTLEGGTLSGDLVVRGAPRPVSMPVRVAREGDLYTATGRWEGKLTALGVKPFKALLGALKLEDRVVLRLEARFKAAPRAPIP
jgi:polyisoprenoid-binding protein YceI